MSLSVDMEVMISLQMVCQETDSILKCHKDRSHRKHLDLKVCQRTATSLDKSLCINIKEMKVTGHLGKVSLVLQSCACSEADRITEIIRCQSRHDCIQIDHTDCFACRVIDHDVVQLGVIVCYTKRKSSVKLHIIQCMCQFFSLQDKINFFLDRGCSSTDILCNSFLEFLKAVRCVMEILDRLMKCLCRIICQKLLKMSECYCALIEIIVVLYCIVAGRSLNKEIDSPVLSIRIHKIRKTCLAFYQCQCLSFRIAAVLDNFFAKPGSNTADIFHQFDWFLKNISAHSLQDVSFRSLCCLVSQSISIIDMTASISDALFEFTMQFEAVNRFTYCIADLHLCFLP